MDESGRKNSANIGIKRLRKAIKEKNISSSEMLTDRTQGDVESQPSDDEIEREDDTNPESFIRTIQDESETQKVTSSPSLPKEQFGVIR